MKGIEICMMTEDCSQKAKQHVLDKISEGWTLQGGINIIIVGGGLQYYATFLRQINS